LDSDSGGPKTCGTGSPTLRLSFFDVGADPDTDKETTCTFEPGQVISGNRRIYVYTVQIHFGGHWKVWAGKIETFLAKIGLQHTVKAGNFVTFFAQINFFLKNALR
jgi:hypothetical protein